MSVLISFLVLTLVNLFKSVSIKRKYHFISNMTNLNIMVKYLEYKGTHSSLSQISEKIN